MAGCESATARWGRAGRRRGARRAFSLVEVLVVIAVIATLVAILLPSMAGARGAARGARELAAGQQLMLAYALYAQEARDWVLPGYPPASWVEGMDVRDFEGQRLGAPVAQRYPWRLLPYVGEDLRGLYKDDALLAALRRDRTMFGYVVSLFPSLGLNAEFVGGSAQGLGFDRAARELYGPFYVTRASDAPRPDRLIVFASARASAGLYPPELGRGAYGYFRLIPPMVTDRNWDEAYDARSDSPGLNSGFVDLRLGGRAAAASLDGHADLLGWDALDDMRRWAPGATSRRWTLERR